MNAAFSFWNTLNSKLMPNCRVTVNRLTVGKLNELNESGVHLFAFKCVFSQPNVVIVRLNRQVWIKFSLQALHQFSAI